MNELRRSIGAKVRELRKARSWTQVELAERLALSQASLSKLERGDGSFSAEQLLTVFRLFNVDASHFSDDKEARREDQLWNAVARLGASHLFESESVLPSERVEHVNDVLREGIVSADSPRLLTGLGAMLIAQADKVQLRSVQDQLERLGLAHRLGWLVENTLSAIESLVATTKDRQLRLRYRRAQVVLSAWLDTVRPPSAAGAFDVLDPLIRSKKTQEEARERSSAISKRWGVLSELLPGEFATAIEAAHG